MTYYKAIGTMSGTSMDGIDVALIETDGTPNHVKTLTHYSQSYDDTFKLLLKAAEYSFKTTAGQLTQNNVDYDEKILLHHTHIFFETSGLKEYIKQFNVSIEIIARYLNKLTDEKITLNDVIQHSTRLHLDAITTLITQSNENIESIHVIGYHGQTMLHQPHKKITIQIGNAQWLADQLNTNVIFDFRKNDVLSGGQGAPFAPLWHQALATRDQLIPLAIVNCGGIANITIINGKNESDLIGYDTGPGNALLDRLVRQRMHGQEHMDTDGRYAQKGNVNKHVLRALHEKALCIGEQNFLKQPPPKSLDINDIQLIDELKECSLEDACKTLAVFTAECIVHSLELAKTKAPQHWVLVGGGWKNPEITNALQSQLAALDPAIKTHFPSELNWNNDAMEAQIFAYLAVRSLKKLPLSLPTTTGVTKPTTGGEIFMPHNDTY